MVRIKKRAVLFVCILCCMLTGCANLQSYRPIEDITNLEGRRIGVGIGYATDYLLTGRDDLTLMRYDNYADMITALCYRRLDAVAVERPNANQFMDYVAGLRIVEPAIQEIGLVAYMANSREDILQEFNAFAAEFQTTEEFADIVTRLNAPGNYQEKTVEQLGNGETISVAIVADNYPYAYLDFETGELYGSDIEYLYHFANACGYKLEVHAVDYTSMELGVVYERYDMGFSAIADVWRADVELTGLALVSDAYMHIDVMFVDVEDFDKLEILQVIEE